MPSSSCVTLPSSEREVSGAPEAAAERAVIGPCERAVNADSSKYDMRCIPLLRIGDVVAFRTHGFFECFRNCLYWQNVQLFVPVAIGRKINVGVVSLSCGRPQM